MKKLSDISAVRALWSALFITAIYPVVGKFAVGLVSPSFILVVGTLITVLFYAPWLTREKMWGKFFHKDVFSKFAVVGLFGTALPFLLIFIALQYTTPSNSAILNQVEVVYSLILTAIFLRERPTKLQLLGTAMVIAGVVLILINESFTLRWKGDIIVISTVWMFQVSHIAAKKLPEGLTPHFISCGRAMFGFFWSVPIALILSFFSMPFTCEFSYTTVGILLFMGIINNAAGNAMWYQAIRNMDLSKATAVILSYPVFTYIISVIVGFDSIHSYQVIGLILALLGAYLVTNIIKQGKNKNEISAI